jgi:hypothetical protein
MKHVAIYLLIFLLPSIVFAQSVTIFENPRFGGKSKTLPVGKYLVEKATDFEGMSSVKIPAGLGVIIYQNYFQSEGYGISADLLEDNASFAALGFTGKIPYLVVFSTVKPDNFWKRNSITNNQFLAGHWERNRAGGNPVQTTVVVSPPIPMPVPTTPTTLAVAGANTTISTLGIQSSDGKNLWNLANNEQLGIIGNDYRGIEEVGSACFERASNNLAIPDDYNFWFPQKQKNDFRSSPYYKRTLIGKLKEARQVNINGTFEDHDLNLEIRPNPKYMYLLTDSHPREYTDIMSKQYTYSHIAGNIPIVNDFVESSGLANCNGAATIEEFNYIEAEIDPGTSGRGGNKLYDLALINTGSDVGVYGVWIYDAGHCCHAEIHPAEQLWWMKPETNGKTYHLNVVGDGSKRFLWRRQMEGADKKKPWGEPPVKGLFAVAFECNLPGNWSSEKISTHQFEVQDIMPDLGSFKHLVAQYPNANKTYNLIYENQNIVSFTPHSDGFNVSFEHVGVVPGNPAKIRGFLVIETQVGKLTRLNGDSILKTLNPLANIPSHPAYTSPGMVPQGMLESIYFKKESGFYIFKLVEKIVSPGLSHQ